MENISTFLFHSYLQRNSNPLTKNFPRCVEFLPQVDFARFDSRLSAIHNLTCHESSRGGDFRRTCDATPLSDGTRSTDFDKISVRDT